MGVEKGRKAEPECVAEIVESSARWTRVEFLDRSLTWSVCRDMAIPHPESTSQSVDLPLAVEAVVESSLAELADGLCGESLSSEQLSSSSDLSPRVTTDVLPALVLLDGVLCLDRLFLKSCLCFFRMPDAV